MDKNIVAIEFGSSSVRALLGQRRTDGTFLLLGFEQESVVDGIRKGVIYNIDKTTQAIVNVVKRLEDRHKVYVRRVYVGLSGQSLRTISYRASRTLDSNTAISEALIDGMIDESITQTRTESVEVFNVVPQGYQADTHVTMEPVGVMAERVEGVFKNIVARVNLQDNIQRCLENAKLELARLYITPQVLSNYMLQDTEMRSGCALVDMGAETTTISVFEKNILRHLVVVPMGGNNITNDIASCFHVETTEAETLKRTYGTAIDIDANDDANANIPISNNRTILLSTLQDVIVARQQEILSNVNEQLKNYLSTLLSGVIFTGGAANMPHLLKAFTEIANYENCKIRLMPTALDYTTNLTLNPQSTTLASVVALALCGDEECTTAKPIEPDLFTQEKEDPIIGPSKGGTTIDVNQPSPQKTIEENVVPDAEPAPTEKKPGILSRAWNGIKHFTSSLVEENSEE